MTVSEAVAHTAVFILLLTVVSLLAWGTVTQQRKRSTYRRRRYRYRPKGGKRRRG